MAIHYSLELGAGCRSMGRTHQKPNTGYFCARQACSFHRAPSIEKQLTDRVCRLTAPSWLYLACGKWPTGQGGVNGSTPTTTTTKTCVVISSRDNQCPSFMMSPVHVRNDYIVSYSGDGCDLIHVIYSSCPLLTYIIAVGFDVKVP